MHSRGHLNIEPALPCPNPCRRTARSHGTSSARPNPCLTPVEPVPTGSLRATYQNSKAPRSQ